MYKYKDKLILYLPKDVVYSLGIKEGDELDFLREEDSYIIAKSNVIIDKLAVKGRGRSGKSVSPKEVSVLRKLDSFRYASRTVEEVDKKLTKEEKEVLEGMIKKGHVVPKKSGNAVLYSINNDIYMNFLIKNPEAFERKHKAAGIGTVALQTKRETVPSWSESGAQSIHENASEEIKRNGYVVLATRAEAESASSELEIEIRKGLVLGTRAFNKKYYIVHRAFINKNSPRLVEALRTGDMSVDELSAKTGIDPDGVRSVMFVLADNGEVMEKRRDLFSLVV